MSSSAWLVASVTVAMTSGSVTRQRRLRVPSASVTSPKGSSCVGRCFERAPGGQLRVGVQREDRREVGLRGAREAQAVGLRAGVRALVRADRAGAVVLDAHAGEEAVAREAAAVGGGVVLDERPDRGLVVVDDRALGAPLVEERCGVGVAVAAVGVLGEVDRDDVVGRACGEPLALTGVDDVVGRGREILQRAGDGGVVVQGSERLDARHRRESLVGLAPVPRAAMDPGSTCGLPSGRSPSCTSLPACHRRPRGRRSRCRRRCGDSGG